MKSFGLLVSILVIGVVLAACGKPPGYRYKLTLEVETHDGIKSGFNVVEIEFHQGVRARGEALYLDLGPGRRPLIALLRRQRWTSTSGWSGEHPTSLLGWVYGEKIEADDPTADKWRARLFRHRGAREISPANLPDLVTFADVNDPKSAMAVDPTNLAQTLGPGVTWKRLTIEITDEPFTKGIEKKLGWLRDYYDTMLDGHRPGQTGDGSFASSVSTAAFWNWGH